MEEGESEVQVILGYILSYQPEWATGDPVSNYQEFR